MEYENLKISSSKEEHSINSSIIIINQDITLKYPDKVDFFSGSIAGVGVGFGGSVHVHGFSTVELGICKILVVELPSVTGIMSGE